MVTGGTIRHIKHGNTHPSDVFRSKFLDNGGGGNPVRCVYEVNESSIPFQNKQLRRVCSLPEV